MKKLTEKQQEIIDTLKAEFNRINSVSKPSGKFNLIDVDALTEDARAVERNKEEADSDRKMWGRMIDDEVDRIAGLIREDLPHCHIHTDKESNLVRIQKLPTDHYQYGFTIYVKYETEWVSQSHGCGYSKGVEMIYECYVNPHQPSRFSTIEELFADGRVRENIRNKFIS